MLLLPQLSRDKVTQAEAWQAQGTVRENDYAEDKYSSLLHSKKTVFRNPILPIALIFTLTVFMASSILITFTPVSVSLQATTSLQD